MHTIDFSDSNKQQDYATHSMFRYFGKLPPTLVSKLLDDYCTKESKVLDLMCGSGTTMVESYIRGMSAVGIDINPLSVIISQAKTTKICSANMSNLLDNLRSFCINTPSEAYSYFRPATRNLDYWFTQTAQNQLSALKYFINNDDFGNSTDDADALKNLLLVSYASIIRKVSNASPRTGRIFRCSEDSTVDAYKAIMQKLQSNISAVNSLPESDIKYQVLIGDARNTIFPSSSFDFVLNHPPYFALYKYSSDVLRFELEWLGYSRKEISTGEIEDGFKTTNALLLDNYISDMKDVFKEIFRVLRNNSIACIVVSDSKLREEQLPVIERLIDAAQASGLTLENHMLRPVLYTQASYHKSANPSIRTLEDHVLVLRKPS